MNVLVTGGAGFVGSVCCEQLLAAGHNVIVVDNLSTQRLIGSISKTDIMLHLAGKVRSKSAR